MKEFIIRRYRSEQSPTPERYTIVRIDDEGKVLLADHQAEAILGYGSDELVGQPVHRVRSAIKPDGPLAPDRSRLAGRSQLVVQQPE